MYTCTCSLQRVDSHTSGTCSLESVFERHINDFKNFSDAGPDEDLEGLVGANAGSSSSSSTTSPTGIKGSEPSASSGPIPSSVAMVTEGSTHRKKPRDRLNTSPTLIRKRREVEVWSFV